MAEHNETGSQGEQIAVDYLTAQGCAIVGRNVRWGANTEIDIIAMDGRYIVFVEVKTRKTADPAAAVDQKRLRRMARCADSYVRNYNIEAEPRIDVISIFGVPGSGEFRIDHFKDVYLPSSMPGSIPNLPVSLD